MTAYQVTAKRWRYGWELHIHGVGVTQARTLATAAKMVREYVALDRDVAEDSFDVEVVPELPTGVLEEARDARRETREAEAAQRRAAQRSKAVVKRLKAEGLSHADVAQVLNIKPARVSQLTKSN